MGLSYFEMQVLLMKLSLDASKEKNDLVKSVDNFFSLIKLKETIGNKGDTKAKPNKFEENVKIHLEEGKKATKNNLQVQKR